MKKDSIEVQRKIYCARHGHSNVLTGCFGYMSCARCGQQVGDTLAGAYSNDKAVLVDHACSRCIANAKKLTKRDLDLLPDNALLHIQELQAKEAEAING